MATKKTKARVNPDPAATTLETPLTAAEKRKLRAVEIKERNRIRLENLAKRKAEAKKAREAKKTGKAAPDPEKVAKATAAKQARDEKEKAVAEATKALVPVAKEVNVRLEKAAKMERDADDHRLAAALQLKTAEEQCKAAGLNFKQWSEANVKGQSYETVRKLLAVGKSEEPMLALMDMRAKNAAANRKLREKQRAEREERRGEELVGAMKDVAADVKRRSEDAGEDGMLEGLEGLKTAFGELQAREQMEFAEWAAHEVGGKFSTDF